MQMIEPLHAYYVSLKASQPERILLSFFAPEAKRESILWLDIFAHEIRNIGRSVTSPHMGLIKLQWWRDEIKKLYAGGHNPPSPVLVALKECISTYHLPFEAFDKILTAHECDLMAEPTASLEELTKYIAGVNAPLMLMKKMILDNGRDNEAAWTSVALATGLVETLQNSQDDSMGYMMVERARQYLEENESISCRYLRAQSVLTKLYCDGFSHVGYNPLLLKPILFKELRVWWGAR